MSLLSALGASLVLLMANSTGPGSMVRVTGHLEYPEGLIVPVTWWRVGFVLGRADEPGSRVVYREPDLWMVDHTSGASQHLVDPGPSLAFHLPVVLYRGDRSWPLEAQALEIGRERTFFLERGVPWLAGAYRYRVPGSTVELVAQFAQPEGVPSRVEVWDGTRQELVVVYDRYETGLAVDATLFEDPTTMRSPR